MPSKFGTLKISRSGLKLFLDCPRCFWLDLHHKIKRPPGYPFTLSIAVDYLVKKEFDTYREKGQLPPVLKNAGIKDAKLFSGPELSEWRNNFKGISYFEEGLNAYLYGAVDDVLEFSDGSLGVIDYKSSGAKEITIYDDYQKQMDVYNYILRQKGHETYPEAFFVFYKVIKEGETGFANALKFTEEVRSVKVNAEWVGPTFEAAVELARSENPPASGTSGKHGYCDHCHFVEVASQYKLIPDLNI
ncbi:MAG: PD-(D/E)XK nuclease family protein [bacterium]|nr:PD-(D/E)XK nuclease family protein [bacterium]